MGLETADESLDASAHLLARLLQERRDTELADYGRYRDRALYRQRRVRIMHTCVQGLCYRYPFRNHNLYSCGHGCGDSRLGGIIVDIQAQKGPEPLRGPAGCLVIIGIM